MDYEDARIYLELYYSRSISKTAQKLGMSQSAVSQRLQKLEREFDMCLMLRGRGQKIVEPTNCGERMVSIAEQWMDLYNSALEMKHSASRTALTVSCTQSILVYLLPHFFLQYAQNYQEQFVRVHTNHSWEIFDLLEDGTIDVGLTNRETVPMREDLQLIPIYRERFVLLTSPRNRTEFGTGSVHPKNLPVERELFFDITPSFSQWRESWWENRQPFLQVSIAHILPSMLVDTPYWSILPFSIAQNFAAQYPLECHELEEQPEKRVCSIVTHRRHRHYKTEQKEQLIQALMDYITAWSIKF